MFLMGLAAMAAAATTPDRLYACGDDQVRELRIAGDAATESWRWTASDATDLPADYRSTLLAHIDDCKPVNDGRDLLVTASTGATVLIERSTGKVLFRAKTPMAHSAALLPGGLVAVALSITPAGNRLELYDSRQNETPLQTLPLPSGHGAVWDARRARLFTLSHDLVQAFRLDRSAQGPRLVETARWTLPGRHDGHDLSPASDGGYDVTTDDGAWSFTPNDGSFRAIVPLNPKLRVKAVSALGDRIAWVQAEESWWAHGFTVMTAQGTDPRRISVEGLHLYKVRWIR
ncbi:DUF6528 family protein [Sphingomonas sp. CROZ-RG-20F-R02-07]|uniref:DUF6528 family protein n=1 Tax=Sphingomonas sp. CROZ-RG-20F-R02-07 TaxID=2914832 RepID=UPI001F586976|nr:DUF6528 family protein [Sphingomonas sp. CROZ-RG-20F-R02-07]